MLATLQPKQKAINKPLLAQVNNKYPHNTLIHIE